jgi:hypothetical protein
MTSLIQLGHGLRAVTLAATATAALLTAGMADAQVLFPGSSTLTPGTTVASEPHLAGLDVADEWVPFSFISSTGLVKGKVQQSVTQSVDGTDDFYWRILLDGGSASRIKTITILGFMQDPSSALLANYRIDGLGDVPSSYASRTTGLGDKISFEMPNGVGPTQSSNFLFLDSKLGTYSRTGSFYLTALDGSSSPLYDTFVPGVPEPSAWAMACLGLLGVYGARRRF